jgi:hypothetical protein
MRYNKEGRKGWMSVITISECYSCKLLRQSGFAFSCSGKTCTFGKETDSMATKKKNSSKGRVWKNERASVHRKSSSKSQSNKYRPKSDSSERPEAGTGERYWRAGYTRKDGTKVKGHYVNKAR